MHGGRLMSTLTEVPAGKLRREVIEQAVIRFAGDSGDGMQITGSQFTNTVALYGNDIATFPDYPAEIVLIASNRPDAPGVAWAVEQGLRTVIVDHK